MTKNINKQMKKDSRHCSNVIVGEREEKTKKKKGKLFLKKDPTLRVYEWPQRLSFLTQW
jgi:hypothetical protein